MYVLYKYRDVVGSVEAVPRRLSIVSARVDHVPNAYPLPGTENYTCKNED